MEVKNTLDLMHYQNRHTLKSKIARAAWNVVWLFLFRPTPQRGLRFFNAWRIFLLRLFGAKIGKQCVIMSSVQVWQPWNLEIGDCVALSENVVCYSVDKIRVGNNVTISREVFLCCASHDVSSSVMELTYVPITIGDNAWIASRAIILPGRMIGEGAVVAAGAVVVDDAEPWAIVGGNPAKFIKKREMKNG